MVKVPTRPFVKFENIHLLTCTKIALLVLIKFLFIVRTFFTVIDYMNI